MRNLPRQHREVLRLNSGYRQRTLGIKSEGSLTEMLDAEAMIVFELDAEAMIVFELDAEDMIKIVMFDVLLIMGTISIFLDKHTNC
jgi:hypothetical protein